ncbi:hypothetical protein J6590_082397 [Homalodisca vitripennis]|nr:hypothetical protein J6590_082397 [Homalodisca vitripennis]
MKERPTYKTSLWLLTTAIGIEVGCKFAGSMEERPTYKTSLWLLTTAIGIEVGCKFAGSMEERPTYKTSLWLLTTAIGIEVGCKFGGKSIYLSYTKQSSERHYFGNRIQKKHRDPIQRVLRQNCYCCIYKRVQEGYRDPEESSDRYRTISSYDSSKSLVGGVCGSECIAATHETVVGSSPWSEGCAALSVSLRHMRLLWALVPGRRGVRL